MSYADDQFDWEMSLDFDHWSLEMEQNTGPLSYDKECTNDLYKPSRYKHEEIKRYQQSLSISSGEKIPSLAERVYWIYAESTKKAKKPTKDSGKWLIFCPTDQIDAAWNQVKDATERGMLGGKSKVSTLKGFRGKDFVICCYTYNWKDEEDVMRVREALRELGFEKPLPYKTDADTMAGKYEATGHKNIAKYYV